VLLGVLQPARVLQLVGERPLVLLVWVLWLVRWVWWRRG
jgi:hypothetical protein